MEEEYQNPEIDNRDIKIENAEAMNRLLQNNDFKKLFSDLYIDAFAITNMYNLYTYDDQTRRRFLEKSLARSTFSAFIQDVIQEGREAKISKQDDLQDEMEEAE